jgi:hypothetical protein
MIVGILGLAVSLYLMSVASRRGVARTDRPVARERDIY